MKEKKRKERQRERRKIMMKLVGDLSFLIFGGFVVVAVVVIMVAVVGFKDFGGLF